MIAPSACWSTCFAHSLARPAPPPLLPFDDVPSGRLADSRRRSSFEAQLVRSRASLSCSSSSGRALRGTTLGSGWE
eukprot:9534234-Alexandrium_andersonii.AAC.1